MRIYFSGSMRAREYVPERLVKGAHVMVTFIEVAEKQYGTKERVLAFLRRKRGKD